MDEKGRYVKGSNAALMERARRSTLPFCLEEAGKRGKSKSKTDLPELIIDKLWKIQVYGPLPIVITSTVKFNSP